MGGSRLSEHSTTGADKYYDVPGAFHKQVASGRSTAAAYRMPTSPRDTSPPLGSSATEAVAGEAYSEMTRFGVPSAVAKRSEEWASSVGRVTTMERDIDFVHRY